MWAVSGRGERRLRVPDCGRVAAGEEERVEAAAQQPRCHARPGQRAQPEDRQGHHRRLDRPLTPRAPRLSAWHPSRTGEPGRSRPPAQQWAGRRKGAEGVKPPPCGVDAALGHYTASNDPPRRGSSLRRRGLRRARDHGPRPSGQLAGRPPGRCSCLPLSRGEGCCSYRGTVRLTLCKPFCGVQPPLESFAERLRAQRFRVGTKSARPAGRG